MSDHKAPHGNMDNPQPGTSKDSEGKISEAGCSQDGQGWQWLKDEADYFDDAGISSRNAKGNDEGVGTPATTPEASGLCLTRNLTRSKAVGKLLQNISETDLAETPKTGKPARITRDLFSVRKSLFDAKTTSLGDAFSSPKSSGVEPKKTEEFFSQAIDNQDSEVPRDSLCVHPRPVIRPKLVDEMSKANRDAGLAEVLSICGNIPEHARGYVLHRRAASLPDYCNKCRLYAPPLYRCVICERIMMGIKIEAHEKHCRL